MVKLSSVIKSSLLMGAPSGLESNQLPGESREDFPDFVGSTKSRVLYLLVVKAPTGFCAPSLVADVGESATQIREILSELESEGLVKKDPIPGHLQISIDKFYYRLNDARSQDAVDLLHSESELHSEIVPMESSTG